MFLCSLLESRQALTQQTRMNLLLQTGILKERKKRLFTLWDSKYWPLNNPMHISGQVQLRQSYKDQRKVL